MGCGREGRRTLVCCEQNVRRLLEMLGDEIAERVVLLLDEKVDSVGHACSCENISLRSFLAPTSWMPRGSYAHTRERRFSDLLFAVSEQEELEAIEGVSKLP